MAAHMIHKVRLRETEQSVESRVTQMVVIKGLQDDMSDIFNLTFRTVTVASSLRLHLPLICSKHIFKEVVPPGEIQRFVLSVWGCCSYSPSPLSRRARRRRSARRPRRTPSSPSRWGRCSFTSRPVRGSDGWAWRRTPPWASTRPARCGPSRPARWRGWWSTWCQRSGAKTPPTSPSSSAPTAPSPPPSRCWISCSTGTRYFSDFSKRERKISHSCAVTPSFLFIRRWMLFFINLLERVWTCVSVLGMPSSKTCLQPQRTESRRTTAPSWESESSAVTFSDINHRARPSPPQISAESEVVFLSETPVRLRRGCFCSSLIKHSSWTDKNVMNHRENT